MMAQLIAQHGGQPGLGLHHIEQALGDRHLGLSSSDVASAFRRVGFEGVVIESVDDRYCPQSTNTAAGSVPAALPLYIVRGRKARERVNGQR